MRLTTWSGISVCVLLAILDARAQQLEVDCDAGDDLAQALEESESSGLTWIAVTGTCVGDFEFAPRVSIRIEGRGATLESPGEGIVMRIGGTAAVQLQGFETRAGAIGIMAVGRESWVTVRQCDIHDNGAGMMAVRGARMAATFSDIHDNDRGLTCADGSRCSIDSSTVRKNDSAVEVEGQSHLDSTRAEIVSNRGNGVLVRGRSSVDVDQTTFSENGASHVPLVERSDAVLQNGTLVGAPGDPTQLALATASLSSAATSRFGTAVEIHGDVLAVDSSFLVFDAARVSGDVQIVDFAKAKILGSAIAGTVRCDSGGDAVCREGSTARIRGCAGARPGCSARSAGDERPGGGWFERLEQPSSVPVARSR